MTGNSKRGYGAGLALAIFLVGFAGSAMGLPCGGRSVNTGDTVKEVAGKCGEAMLKEERVVTVEGGAGSGSPGVVRTVTDEWTYNFGPGEQMQTYRFENGRLVVVTSPGYGRPVDDANDTCRNGELLTVGDSYLDAYLKCGEPIAREKLPDKVTVTEEGSKKLVTTVQVVEWTYRYGPDAPGYTLRLENGLVTDIRTRAFGE